MTFISSEMAEGRRLSDRQIDQWRESGYTLVQGLIDRQQQLDVLALADQTFPKPSTEAAAKITDFGSNGAWVFPSAHRIFNEITLCPHLLRAVASLLGVEVEQLRLTQSDLWPKYGRTEKVSSQDNMDQRIHVDYPNHSLVHPPEWSRPEAVELMLYYSDASDCGGETAVVPRAGPDDDAYRWPIVDSPGIGALTFTNDRVSAEAALQAGQPEMFKFRTQLYNREVYVDFRQGDILFYRHDTWHRGTPLRPGTRRLAQNMTFRVADAEWISTLHPGWAWSAYRPSQYLEKWIATCSVLQRTVMGFPAPGNAYWTEKTVAAVTARYGPLGFDPTPYLKDRSE
ncbi:MAG: hypothetical protein ACPHAN_01095 [Pseudomonadales bacterium]